MKQHAQELSESQKVEVVELDQRITRVLMTFNKHIASLDLTTDGAGIVQMKPALDSYENEKKLGGFVLEVKALVKRTGIIVSRYANKMTNGWRSGLMINNQQASETCARVRACVCVCVCVCVVRYSSSQPAERATD